MKRWFAQSATGTCLGVRTLHTMFLVLHVLTVPSATLELLRFGPSLLWCSSATCCSCGRAALAYLREQVFLQKLIMEPSFGHFNTVKFIYNPKVNSPAEKTRARRVCAHRAVFEQTYPPRILEKSSTCEPFFKSRNKNNSDPPSHTTKGLKPSIFFSSVAFTKEK